MAETARLFVAATPPAPVLDLIEGFSRPEEPGVRYTTRDQWHITLRFLGRAVVDDVRAALDRLTAEPGSARLGREVTRLGRSVVVIPVDGLDDLAAAVVEATGDVGQAPDTHPFHGHLTLARLKNRATSALIGQTIRAGFVAREIHLVRSELGRAGARYEIVDTWPVTGTDSPA